MEDSLTGAGSGTTFNLLHLRWRDFKSTAKHPFKT